jgi:hypothetical protein
MSVLRPEADCLHPEQLTVDGRGWFYWVIRGSYCRNREASVLDAVFHRRI